MSPPPEPGSLDPRKPLAAKKMWAGVGALEPARLDPRPASINRLGRKFPAFFPFRALRRTGGFDSTPRAALARLPGILASAVTPPHRRDSPSGMLRVAFPAVPAPPSYAPDIAHPERRPS